jgi:hypothetical protein
MGKADRRRIMARDRQKAREVIDRNDWSIDVDPIAIAVETATQPHGKVPR